MMNLLSLKNALFFITLAFLGTGPAFAQAVPSGAGPGAYTPEQLEKLVGPVALYPDDLIAITLPATTYPLDVVKAQRFLEARKADPKAPEDKTLADPVVKLLNYPVIVKMMNDDLDWMQSLGDAVEVDESGVLAAIQAFRHKAEAAGNLKTDDKQKVVVEKDVIVIQPANPEVIYVPTYQPATVVTYSAAPYAPMYYPAPYPSYYYPYAPGAAFATGLIFGAAIGGAWNTNWGGGDININRNSNVNVNRPGGSGGGGNNWRNDRAPSQTKAGAQTRQASPGSRPGDASNRGGSRQSDRGGNMQNRDSASNRGGSQAGNRGGNTQNRDSAFGGSDSGARANRDSARGASSMSSSRSGGGRSGGGMSSGGRSGGGMSGGGRSGGGGRRR
jgi:hypothetical protein